MKVPAAATLHPAFILRGQFAEEPAQIRTLERIRELLVGTRTVHPVGELLPNAHLYPTLEELRAFRAGGGPVAVDIESAGDYLRMVGLTRESDLAYVAIWLRTQGGGPAGPEHEILARAEWLAELLADPTVLKVFHNGISYDVPLLERLGFVVENIEDTMLLLHVAGPEQSKALQAGAIRYLAAPAWKHLADAEEEGEGK